MKNRKKKHCFRCDTVVKRETERMEGEYPYYCPNCDENLYSFEVYKTKKKGRIVKDKNLINIKISNMRKTGKL